MNGVAADHAAERDDAVIGGAARRGIERDRNGSRDFERTRHADAIELRARFLQRFGGAGKERIGNVVVKARLDNEDARAFALTFVTLASPRAGHHDTPSLCGWSNRRAA